ncbi:hypothetical protein T484DRAFT_1817891 [Baffinella frigidus]|nr:hypothetical protein T484DRAFT_1817891 [Cryptophyta sp. CCMP2293]
MDRKSSRLIRAKRGGLLVVSVVAGRNLADKELSKLAAKILLDYSGQLKVLRKHLREGTPARAAAIGTPARAAAIVTLDKSNILRTGENVALRKLREAVSMVDKIEWSQGKAGGGAAKEDEEEEEAGAGGGGGGEGAANGSNGTNGSTGSKGKKGKKEKRIMGMCRMCSNKEAPLFCGRCKVAHYCSKACFGGIPVEFDRL